MGEKAKKVKNGIIIFVLCACTAIGGWAAEHFGHVSDKANALFQKWGWVRVDDTDVATETTANVSEAACKIAKAKSGDFYAATELRYNYQLDRNSTVNYVPVSVVANTNDKKIDVMYSATASFKGNVKSDILTASLSINNDNENEEKLIDFAKDLKNGNEEAAGTALWELSQNANINVSYAQGISDYNSTISGYLASKVDENALGATLDQDVKAAIIANIASGDYVVTNYSLTPDATSKGQSIGATITEKTDGNGTAYYGNLNAENVSAEATLRTAYKDKVYYVTINLDNLTFNLGEQKLSEYGLLPKETLATLIDEKIVNEESLANVTANSPVSVTVDCPIQGTTLTSSNSVTIGLQFNSRDEQITNDINAAMAQFNAQTTTTTSNKSETVTETETEETTEVPNPSRRSR